MKNSMKCIYQAPGNPDCQSCKIKKHLLEDGRSISGSNVELLGLDTQTRKGDSWISLRDTKWVICGRGKEISVS